MWSKICSTHFVGGKPSTDPSSPSYAPTIFPSSYRNVSTIVQDKSNRYNRWRKRAYTPVRSTNTDEADGADDAILTNADGTDDAMCYSDTPDEAPCNETLVSSFLSEADAGQMHEVATQTDESCGNTTGIFLSCALIATVSEASVQCSSFLMSPKETCEKGIGTVNADQFQPRGFRGYDSVTSESDHAEVLKDLTGVSPTCFAVLLGLLTQVKTPRAMDISRESRLLLFLMKMKHALTFAALGALFSVHRTTASRTFYATLDTLYSKTQGWLIWFPREVVQETMPHSFREKCPTCRVIIDCTEVPIEKPPEVSEQVNCWSSYKSNFTLKFLVGVTPCGFISFVSRVFGGRSSDTYITANSGLLDLLEPNDLVMADKGFPHIRCDLDARQVTLEIPPFARMNEQFTALEVERTYKIASHRVHVERCIQRIKIFNILNAKLPQELRNHVDKIVTLCCVLANMQKPIFKNL
ncbi:uncharacterized protein LOC135373250 [Ornithodoros turicata]|uniref:uncharacterized protein LOC135373250 n=1 Tax=Ornithodoros turicata TaxID=34597 RepID=UPI003139D5DD